MAKNLRNSISERYELISKTITELEKKTNSLPDGRISVKHDNGCICYYRIRKESADKYLSKKDGELIEDLIQKSYLKKVLKSAKQEAEALRKALKQYPAIVAEEVYDNLTDERKKYARSIIIGDDQYARKWQERPYTPKSFSDDVPVYLTMRGERVRSKSEIIIADRLYANGIPYKYECPVMIGDKIIHPDFTILRISDRKILYHEHCGRMDDPDYAEEMVKRINEYNREGIILGDRLFLSFETSDTPLDSRVIDNLINKHFR